MALHCSLISALRRQRAMSLGEHEHLRLQLGVLLFNVIKLFLRTNGEMYVAVEEDSGPYVRRFSAS